MDFQFNLNLQRMAKQSYAVSLWETADTRKKMKEYFYKHNRVKTEDEWQNIMKSVIKLLDPTTLPLLLYTEMIYIVREIGLKIFDWFNSLNCMSLFSEVDRKSVYDHYFQKIYWTYYGTINGLKILRSWMDTPNVDPFVVYSMSCMYCLEDELPRLWRKIPLKLRQQIRRYKNQFYQKYGYYIVAYWLASHNEDSFALDRFNQAITLDVGEFEEFLDNDQSPEANMFVFSAQKGYRKAVEHFWESITPIEQEKNLVNALNWALRVIGSRNWCNQYHRKEQFIETCIFLMKKLDKNSLEKVIKYKCSKIPLLGTEPRLVSQNTHNIIDLFINIWPWQEFFMTAFNLVKSYFNEKDYHHMFTVITFYMKKDYESIKSSVYQRMLHAVWREMPNDMKKVIEWAHVEILFQAWDLPSIKMILNDPFINEIRNDLMNQVFVHLIELLNDDQTDKVDHFIDEVLNDDNTENGIPVNQIFKFIMKDDFNSIKDLQKSYSKEEFEKIKSEIKPEFVCRYLIARNEFDSADKFLNWIFDKESEIDHFKVEFKEKNFTRNHIYQTWIKSNEKTAEELSEKFIKWFVKTPEELASFKKKWVVIVGEDDEFYPEDISFFYEPFIKADRYEIVLPLLKWCGINESYVEECHKSLIQDVRIPFYMETNQIDMAENYLKWAFKTKELRIDHLRSLVNSKKGFLCCKKFIGSACADKTDDLKESFKRFIDFWIKPAGGVKKTTRKLISWKEKLKKLDEQKNDEEEWDLWSSFNYRENSDRSLHFDRNEIYCPEEKLNLFLSLLDSLESGDDQNEEDDDGDDDDDDDTSNSSDDDDMSGSSYNLNFSDCEEDDDDDDEVEDDEDDDFGEDEDPDQDEDPGEENEECDDSDSDESEGERMVIEAAGRIIENMQKRRKLMIEPKKSDEESEILEDEAGRFDDAEEKPNEEIKILDEENDESGEVVEKEIVNHDVPDKCQVA